MGDFFFVKPLFCHMAREINRSQVAHSNLLLRGVKKNFSTKIRTVNDADMILRRADIRGVFESDPGVACFKKHAEHFPPELHSFNTLKKANVSLVSLFFVRGIARFESCAIKIV